MFNQRVRQTGASVGTSTVKRWAAAIGALGLLGGLVVAAPAAATTAATHATWAQGRFLSGSLAGVALSRIAELTPATARNDGSQGTQEVVDPLAVSLLGSAPVTAGSVRVSPDDVVDTTTSGGALSQYARAERTGAALGASGTIGKGGAIGPNASNPGGALTLSFDELIDDSFASVITDLRLQVQAVAAQARGTLQSVDGDYFIDGLTLTFTSPAIAGLSATVSKAVSAAEAKLDSLTGRNGELAVALKALLVAANPALSLAGTAKVSVSLSHDLEAAVADLMSASWGGSGVSFDATTGRVSVDLEKLVDGDLNDRPVNSELLTGATVTRIVSTIASDVSTLADQLLSRIELALNELRLDVDADLLLLTDRAPIVGEVCQYRDGAGNILNELLGKLHGSLVCTPTTTLLPKLETSVSVDVHGTVAQVLDGRAPATAKAKALGVPVALSTGRILDGLGLTLGSRIFGTGGALPQMRTLLEGPLLAQANAGLLGSTSVRTALSDLLSIKVNLQETTLSGGGLAVATNTVFTQTALRVGVARPVAAGGLTTLNIAAASVAPVVTTGGPGTDDPGTDDGSTPTATDRDDLAYTGVTIGAIIAALLALLAAGAWLAREGYRRSHPPLEP